jgi:hypothetical protein
VPDPLIIPGIDHRQQVGMGQMRSKTTGELKTTRRYPVGAMEHRDQHRAVERQMRGAVHDGQFVLTDPLLKAIVA